MRIISGTYRGRALLGPEDDQTTRPITDRVKENLFNRLHSLGVLGYGRVADVFSGTGSMGLEALSRGAEHCVFVDQDRSAVKYLQQNLDTLGVPAEQAQIVNSSALLPGWTLGLADGGLTLVFLDPPYAMTSDLSPFVALLESLLPKLEVGGVVVLRTPAEIEGPPVAGYDGPAHATYGGMALHFYQAPLPEDEPEEG